jgi:transcriptional regulator with XRE-family HTH domain
MLMRTKSAPVADEFIAEKKIGERIRRLRLKKSMGLVELGKHTGFSASFLSQLENGRVVPTLRNLARIAMVFSKDLAYFFEPEPQAIFRLHRKADRVKLPEYKGAPPAYLFESLAYHVPDRRLDAYWAEFAPLPKGVAPRQHSHPGYEFFYVVAGTIELTHGSETDQLQAGDSAYFDATTLHSYHTTAKRAEALIVTTDPDAHPEAVKLAEKKK